MDLIVLLTPLALFAVVLALGFAGCSFEPGTLPPPPPPPPSLTFRVRVPSALVTTQVSFTWESPSTPRKGVALDNPSPTSAEGTDNVFDHVLDGQPASETWTVRCQVTVQGGASPGPFDSEMFTLDGSLTSPVATFQAMGSAADLTVAFVGVT